MEVWRGVWRCLVWPDVCSGSGGGASCADHAGCGNTCRGATCCGGSNSYSYSCGAGCGRSRPRCFCWFVVLGARPPCRRQRHPTRAGGCRAPITHDTQRAAPAGAARERDVWRDERPEGRRRRHAHRVSTKKREGAEHARSFMHHTVIYFSYTQVYLLLFFVLLDYGAE